MVLLLPKVFNQSLLLFAHLCHLMLLSSFFSWQDAEGFCKSLINLTFAILPVLSMSPCCTILTAILHPSRFPLSYTHVNIWSFYSLVITEMKGGDGAPSKEIKTVEELMAPMLAAPV